MNARDDLDDTARLILMDDPGVSLTAFALRLATEVGHDVTSGELGVLWSKYRGWDGRSVPTHDVTTGFPL